MDKHKFLSLESKKWLTTSDHVRVQCFDTRCQRLVSRVAIAGQFADHRIVIDANLAAFLNAAVTANIGNMSRFYVVVQATDGRQSEILERVFGVDTTFDSPTSERDVFLLQIQRMS